MFAGICVSLARSALAFLVPRQEYEFDTKPWRGGQLVAILGQGRTGGGPLEQCSRPMDRAGGAVYLSLTEWNYLAVTGVGAPDAKV